MPNRQLFVFAAGPLSLSLYAKSVTVCFLPVSDGTEPSRLEDYRTSVEAIEKVTQFTSCEFAVRPFINKISGRDDETVIKHGCRTLLKQGNPVVMSLFGLGAVKDIRIENLRISMPEVKVGGEFRFNLLNNGSDRSRIRLEYRIYYRKANGALTKKVYKISKREYVGNSVTPVTRRHSFRVVTARRFHPGLHQVAVMINGNELEKYDFELIE